MWSSGGVHLQEVFRSPHIALLTERLQKISCRGPVLKFYSSCSKGERLKSFMKKAFLLGGAFLGLSVISQASWIDSKAAVSRESSKALSTLGSLVEERGIVLASMKPAGASSKSVALTGLGSTEKASPTRWKDVGADQLLTLVETDLALAKNDAGPAPEAGTWAAGVLISVVALRRWIARA